MISHITTTHLLAHLTLYVSPQLKKKKRIEAEYIWSHN